MGETLLNAPAMAKTGLDSTSVTLQRVLTEHGKALDRLVRSYTATESDRHDLWQDVSIALWRALPRFRSECSERGFVLRVAHNRALSHLAARGRRGPTVDTENLEVAGTSGSNPAVRYERSERENRLLVAVRALPVPLRQVILLSLEGLDHQEIAKALGTTENNVAVRAHRARAALRVLLEEPTKETP